MRIRVQPINITEKPVKILIADYKKRRVFAYQNGIFNSPINATYTFEQDEWDRGRVEDQRIRQEMARGER